MQIYSSLNQVSEYIERHLEEQIQIAKIAGILGCSQDLAPRFFSLLTGISLKDYIRSRRLTLAFKDILNGEKCIDVALRYGYQAEASLSRAFKKQHGISPGDVKKKPTVMKVQPKLHFEDFKEGIESITVTLRKLPSQTFYGVLKEVDINNIPPIAESLWKESKETVFEKQDDLVGLTYQVGEKYYYACASPHENPSLQKITFPQGLWISLLTKSQRGQDIKEKFESIYKESFESLAFPRKGRITRELELYQDDSVECLVYIS